MFESKPIKAGTRIPRYRLRLEISGANIVAPIVSGVMSYMVVRSTSQLPTADVTVPVGLEMGTGKMIKAFAILSHVKRTDLARIVYYAGDSLDGFVLFEGRVTNVAMMRTSASYGVTVSLVHWLADLDGCAAYFPSFDALFPSSAYRRIGSGNATLKEKAKEVMSSVHSFAFSLTPGPDAWTNFVDAVTKAYDRANGDMSGTTAGGAASASGFYSANLSGINALKRIFSLSTFGKAGLAAGKSDAMKTMLATIALTDDTGGRTMLEKVLAYCDVMNLMLVPSGASACVAPEGSFANDLAKTIPLDEQAQVRLMSARNRVLRGCVMLGVGGLSNDGTLIEFDNAAIAAYGDIKADGPMISVPAPPWLEGLALPEHDMMTKAGAAAELGQSRSSSNAVGYVLTGTPADNADKLALQDAANAWCRMYLASQMTLGNLATITGPLRFDIGPGTQLACTEHEGQFIYGMVEGVRVNFDAQQAMVSTEYAISGARSESEQLAYGLKYPPLYKEYMASCSIV